MDLVTPSIGLIFWQIILFIILLFLLAKFAWNPILQLIEKRQEYLLNSLQLARKTQQEISSFENEKQNWIKKSRIEHDLLIEEARNLSNKMIQQAIEKAQGECQKMFLQAKDNIENQKKLALIDIKNYMADLSIKIAEKLIKIELKRDQEQEKLISNLVNDFK